MWHGSFHWNYILNFRVLFCYIIQDPKISETVARRCSVKKVFLKSCKMYGKNLYRSLFCNKVEHIKHVILVFLQLTCNEYLPVQVTQQKLAAIKIFPKDQDSGYSLYWQTSVNYSFNFESESHNHATNHCKNQGLGWNHSVEYNLQACQWVVIPSSDPRDRARAGRHVGKSICQRDWSHRQYNKFYR